jgi:hypothetical protein
MTGTDESKPATAARIYDYLLGGVHNFPADREAARVVLATMPDVRLAARANRAFLSRAVRLCVDAGIRQFIDIGSGIPTQGNVHEIAQDLAPDTRVVYVDIDPVAVAEGLEMLEGNERATAIRANLTKPREILDHRGLHRLIDFDRPVAVLALAVLHFIADDETAYGSLGELVGATAPGSFLVVSHGADTFDLESERARSITTAYRERTATPAVPRSRTEVKRFFEGLELLDPGVVWVPEWRRPDHDDPDPLAGDPARSSIFAGVGRKP